MTAFLHALQRQPEYVHILINPLPIYGLAISWIGLVIAFFCGAGVRKSQPWLSLLISAACGLAGL